MRNTSFFLFLAGSLLMMQNAQAEKVLAQCEGAIMLSAEGQEKGVKATLTISTPKGQEHKGSQVKAASVTLTNEFEKPITGTIQRPENGQGAMTLKDPFGRDLTGTFWAIENFYEKDKNVYAKVEISGEGMKISGTLICQEK